MSHGPARHRGASAVEFAIAAPVVLLLGLGALQWALVFHSRQAVEHAAIESARAGSVGHGLPAALEAGLARGLLPLWSTFSDIRGSGGDRTATIAAAQVRLRQAQSAGWVVIRRLSPTREGFADWGEPPLDAQGRPMTASVEIPNDSLMFAEQRMPRGGSARMHLGMPVGAASGQTLLDANLLKIEVIYGVPMTVPLVGRIAALAGQLLGGCLPVERGGCIVHQAPDASGRPVPRWPVATVATVRMQSPARSMADAPPRGSLPGGFGATSSGASGGGPAGGEVSPPAAFRPPPGATGASFGGIDAAHDGTLGRAESGWLSLGGDRVFSVPGACSLP